MPLITTTNVVKAGLVAVFAHLILNDLRTIVGAMLVERMDFPYRQERTDIGHHPPPPARWPRASRCARSRRRTTASSSAAARSTA